MKKIAIDATALSDQYKDRGIGVYARNLVSRLLGNKGFEWHLLGFDEYKAKMDTAENVRFHSLGSVRPSNPSNLGFFRRKYLSIIRNIGPDLYFAPHFERGLPIGLTKVAVMMHDLTPLITNRFSTKGPVINLLKGVFYKYNLREAKKADLVLTNSNFTKGKLKEFGFDERKVVVTYLGLSKEMSIDSLQEESVRDAILHKYQISKPYIFYYGGLEGNKGVDKLIKAFHIVRRKSEIQLIIVDKGLSKEGKEIIAQTGDALRIKEFIHKYKLEDQVVLPGFIEGEDLPAILYEAEVFVHLSSMEGFGLVVLEAMAIGVPVVASDRSCYPEVVGNGALLVDPDKEAEVASAIFKILKDENLKRDLLERGKRQAGKYNWDRTVARTLEAFCSVLDSALPKSS